MTKRKRFYADEQYVLRKMATPGWTLESRERGYCMRHPEGVHGVHGQVVSALVKAGYIRRRSDAPSFELLEAGKAATIPEETKE